MSDTQQRTRLAALRVTEATQSAERRAVTNALKAAIVLNEKQGSTAAALATAVDAIATTLDSTVRT